MFNYDIVINHNNAHLHIGNVTQLMIFVGERLLTSYSCKIGKYFFINILLFFIVKQYLFYVCMYFVYYNF